jgi:predicted RNase H-like HicB family nuclease
MGSDHDYCSICMGDALSTIPPKLWKLRSMMKQFDVVIEKDSEGYYVASVPALQGCHTQAKSLDELMERIREAIELCLEVQGEPHESLDFVGVQRVSVAA